MKRPARSPLSDETLDALEEYKSYEGKITKLSPALLKGSEPSEGLKRAVREAKAKFVK